MRPNFALKATEGRAYLQAPCYLGVWSGSPALASALGALAVSLGPPQVIG